MSVTLTCLKCTKPYQRKASTAAGSKYCSVLCRNRSPRRKRRAPEGDTKQCKKCSETKPVQAFYRQSKRRGGRWNICKKCADKQKASKATPPPPEGSHKECLKCRTRKPIEEFYPTKHRTRRQGTCKACVIAKQRTYHQANRDAYLESCKRGYQNQKQHNLAGMKLVRNERARRMRREAIEAYGGKCVCCGESTFEFLSIDHIYNDGALERRTTKLKGGMLLYKLKKLGYPKDRYQLLCHNCNMAKGFYGLCPHQAALTVIEPRL